VHGRAKSERRFVKLFEDAKRRIALESKRRKMVADTECTFNPNRDLTHNFKGHEHRRPLYEDPKQRKNSLKDSSYEFDMKTGQPLYKPQIGRAPKNRPKVRTKSIGEYLCSLTKRKNNSISEESNSGILVVQEKSNKIVKKMRKDGFTMIFKTLDFNNTGLIDSDSLNLQKLPKEIVKIFMPIFKEMEEMKCSLNLEEFIDAANNLFKELTIVQKNEFLNLYRSLEVPKKTLRTSMYSPYKECSFKVLYTNKGSQLFVGDQEN